MKFPISVRGMFLLSFNAPLNVKAMKKIDMQTKNKAILEKTHNLITDLQQKELINYKKRMRKFTRLQKEESVSPFSRKMAFFSNYYAKQNP